MEICKGIGNLTGFGSWKSGGRDQGIGNLTGLEIGKMREESGFWKSHWFGDWEYGREESGLGITWSLEIGNMRGGNEEFGNPTGLEIGIMRGGQWGSFGIRTWK